MPERTNGGVFNDQVLTGSLKHYRIIGADFRGATDAENRPIHGSAAEIVFSEISRRATVAIMNPVTSDDGISFALETNRASWTIEALETLIRSLGTIGIDNVDVSNVEVERAAYDLISGGSSTFIGLDDTPADYAGFEDYYVVVNTDGTGLEFVPGGTGSGVVTSVFGRDGDVDAQNGDYNSDQVTNNSSVTGGSVSDALEAIEEVASTAIQPNDNVSELVNDANYLTDITNESLGDLSDVDLTGAVDGQAIVFDGINYVPQDVVNSYNGRVGDVVPVDNDYTTNMIENVSGVEGENTSEALENIDAIAQTALQPGDDISELTNDANYINAGEAPVQSVAGKDGVVTLVKADITDFDEADYATAGEGSLANSALQPNDNISELTNDSGYLTDITAEALGDLSDVDTTGVVDGQLMTWDTDKFIATDIDGGEFIGEDVVVTSRSIPVKSNEIVTPENPNVGDQYFNTTLNKPLWWTGSAWVDSNGQAI